MQAKSFGQGIQIFEDDIASLASISTSALSRVFPLSAASDQIGIVIKGTVGVSEAGLNLVLRVFECGSSGLWSTRYREFTMPLSLTGDVVTEILPYYVRNKSQIRFQFYNSGANAVTNINASIEI